MSAVDAQTIAAYAQAAARYAQGFARTKDTDQEDDYAAFATRLTPGARVLDLGCGPGHWTARMLHDGFAAEGWDASPEMAEQARAAYGIDVRVASFADLQDCPPYDGIWANFSLLHAPKADFPGLLRLVHAALTAGGTLSLGMKLGEGERRDSLGRLYAYYSKDALHSHLTKAGFTVLRSHQGDGKGLAGGVETFAVMTAHA